MTVSSLSSVSIISPNTSGLRTAPISKVTVHHMAGDLTVEQCGSIFKSASRQASSNYGVGSDGRIGCYLEEEYHPWTSSSYWNDDRAITLEVADYNLGDWSPSKAAYQATVLLCADICTRYGIEPEYTGDANGTFTEHRMFAATSCPGDWWHAKMPEFIEDVKAAMAGEDDEVRPEDITAIVNAIAFKGEPFNAKGLYYKGHVENIGWDGSFVRDGQAIGSEGDGLRLEAIHIIPPKGVELKVSAYLSDKGWVEYDIPTAGGVIGTEGESRAIEAIRVTANVPIRYRAHVSYVGWQDWKSDGEEAGELGQRIEAFQMVLA